MKNVCAIIITYNCSAKIIEVIDSVVNQVDSIIIVDNGSNQKCLSILEELEKVDSIKIIYNKFNYGIAKALNIGIKYALENGYEWVLTLDHDSVCEKSMISKMFKCFTVSKCDISEVGIICPRVYDINKGMYIDKVKENDEKKDYYFTTDCIQSGSLYNINIFRSLGYFNEELFIYHVDFDFCEKIIKNGYKIIKCNSVKIFHEEGAKIQKKLLGMTVFYNNYSSNAVYYITRNTIYMAKKYNLKYLKRILKDFIFIIIFDNNRKELLKYWVRGVRDGLKNQFGPIKL